MLFTRRYLLAAALTLTATLGSTVAQADKKKDQDIVDAAVAAGSFKTLAAALQAADLADTLKGKGPFTVFAPTDEAFARLPKVTLESLLKPESKGALAGILTYHVVSGEIGSNKVVRLNHAETLNGQRVDIAVKDGNVFIDSAKVVAADIRCSNGVIHVIDSVILPSSDNIPATADKAGSFKTLLAAAKAAKLVGVLSGDKPLTVFAPTDEAFARLPKGTVDSLLKPQNIDQLKQIVLYHVVEGRVYSDQALKLTTAKTLNGQSIKINARKAGAFINDSKLTALDIEASNGVIHVIDQVLLPLTEVSNDKARASIEETIRRGASLYNAGHVDACAKHYMASVSGLLNSNHKMPRTAVYHLESAMTQARATQCTVSQSWALRRGLDGAHHVLAVR